MSRRQRRTRSKRRRHAAITRRAGGLAVAATLLSGSAAEAATFSVTNTNASGSGSLAAAITDANSAGGNNTIVFESGLSGAIDLTTALPKITDPLTITGPGARTLTINGEGHQIFYFEAGASPSDTVSGLTLTGAKTVDNGGAIYSEAPALDLEDVTISGNQANYGGGIMDLDGHVTITGSTISGNTALAGGGVDVGSLTATSATIADNTATEVNEAGGAGGGIELLSGPSVITDSTISGNAATGADGDGGGVYIAGGATSFQNTIVAGNGGNGTANDIKNSSGVAPTASFSLIQDTSGSGITPSGTDLIGKDPQLGPLQDNGGATDTMMPRLDSPVIDAGKAFGQATDQRGLTRPVDLPAVPDAAGGDGSDIGAVEVQSSEAAPATETVTNTDDSGAGSLRAAIDSVNGHPGQNAITFQSGLSGSIDLASSLPGIYQPVDIEGPGARTLTVNGDGHRMFAFDNGYTTSPLDEISGLTLTGGSALGDGGAVAATGYPQLVLDKVTVSHSTASGQGGGVFAIGQLSINQSTFYDNTGAHGGGIAADNGLILEESTVTGNTATVEGGGVYAGPQRISIQDSTISGNKASGATAQGGGLSIYKGALSATLDDTIVSGNTAASGPDIFTTPGGVVPTAAFSLIDNLSASGITAASSDITGENPDLDALGNNGGPTDTMLPADNSPVIDQGSAFGATQDQRGLPRPVDLPGYPNAAGGDGSDIGSVELQSSEVQQMIRTGFHGQELVLTMPAPNACTATNTGLPVEFSSDASSGSKLKFSSAAFYVDRGIKRSHKKLERLKHGKHKRVTVVKYVANALVHHNASRLSIKLAHEKTGTHTLKVIVSYREKVRKHHHKVTVTVTKTLKAKFKIC